MPKWFVLDTNVLLHSPTSVTSFGDNTVVVPVDVIEELDKFKSMNDELGHNARSAIRVIDTARGRGSLGDGVTIGEEGGRLMIDLKPVCLIADGLSTDSPDNRIISVAYRLKREGKPVVLVSKDMNMRVKCDALGIPAEDFQTDKVPEVDELHTGWRELEASGDDIERLRERGMLELGLDQRLVPNEAVLLRAQENPKNTCLARPIGLHEGGMRATLGPFRSPNDAIMGVAPRNLEQRIALEMLLDRDVRLVTLVGKAGTGKTLLALVAGLSLVTRKHHYAKMLVARPIMPLGKDIGFLPGTADEKLTPWMKPIFDNIKYILRDKQPGEADRKINDLFKSGVIEIEPLTYIRGRSIHNQFIIVDECQNLTPHQVKTIISRCGNETKLVLTGDPFQIDNPYLDSRSNGLTYVAERFKGQEIAAHVLFRKSERSELARIAVELL
ncbi:MAG TPA: phosphate starvation-inducible protein PhoH [Planctomycetes bacterium]|nr:phosphate starvation-inducible protein PhoH [Planctomycetota bacterium]